MARTLVVPGVSVEVTFDVAPPLPARSGVLGAVGVVDRAIANAPVAVTSRRELLEIAGPATRWSFPEALSALANGVSELVLSPVDPRTGAAASLTLRDADGDDVVLLRARAPGPWGNDLRARVVPTVAADGRTVRRVRVDLFMGEELIESHENLALRPGEDDDLFVAINRDSQAVVAIDPLFLTDLPVSDAEPVAFEDSEALAATATLRDGSNDVLLLTALTPGEAGNTLSVSVEEGRARVDLPGAADAPSLVAWSVAAGATGLAVSVTEGASGISIDVVDGGNVRNYADLATVQAAVTALQTDPAVRLERVGDVLPAPVTNASLAPTRTVAVQLEGVRTLVYAEQLDATALAAAMNAGADRLVTATVGAGSADRLPAVGATYLTNGRDAGLARRYAGRNNPAPAVVLMLHPAPGSDGENTRLQVRTGTLPNTTRLTLSVLEDGAPVPREDHDNLTMDPDDARYLPAVLASSSLVRAVDTYTRSRATTFPRAISGGAAFTGGRMPRLDAFTAAIDALESEDAVDLVLAGLQGWRDDALDGVAVQQALLAHCIAQADAARPRIALGSVSPAESLDVRAIRDHAGQVSSRRFVLVTPSGAEGALAGLLGHLDYFHSPTFKIVAQPGVPLVRYSEAELTQLVGPQANVCVVSERRGRGVLCVKGISTDGFQISVTRVADRCVREVNAIANRFIGELNNADARNALKQMIVATFTQMERDGALVPSVDGKQPAFLVDVYASQEDTAVGIVRVDIAVRPVRAIDYVYASIRVKN